MPQKKTKKRGGKTTARKRNSRKKQLSRSLRIYQKIAIVFVILSLLLLLGVLYLSISSAVIRIKPNPTVVSTTVGVQIVDVPTASGQVEGVVREENFQKAKIFPVPQDGGTPIEAKARGLVTLINETPTQVDLVATTRLLSEEGVLFRLEDAVSIPANGQLEATVAADQPGLSGEIGPSQFTIPGLPSASQEVVYAVSVDSMAGGVEYRRVLTQTDLDQAIEELSDEIKAESKALLADDQELQQYDGEYITVTVIDKASDTEPGAEVGSFTISVTVRVTAVFYDREAFVSYAKGELFKQLPDGFQFQTINEEGLQITVQNVNGTTGEANLSVYLDGISTLSAGSELLDIDRFLGNSPTDIVELLEASEAIHQAHISFTPFWLKRIPTLKDHIKIIIEPVE